MSPLLHQAEEAIYSCFSLLQRQDVPPPLGRRAQSWALALEQEIRPRECGQRGNGSKAWSVDMAVSSPGLGTAP